MQRLASTAPAEARLLLDELIATGPTHPTWPAEHQNLLARIACAEGAYDVATAAAERSESLAERGSALAADARNLRGIVALERASYEEATEAFVAAQELYRALGDDAGIARTTNNLGLVFWRVDDLDRAEAAFLDALPVFAKLSDARAVGTIENNVGLLASARGAPEAALSWYGRALKTLRDAGDPASLANAYANVADERVQLGHYDDALAAARMALHLRRGAGNARGVAGSCLALARLHLCLGQRGPAEEHLKEGETLARSMGLGKHVADALELRALVAALDGDGAEAVRLTGLCARERRVLVTDQLRARLAGQRSELELVQARRERDARIRENHALVQARDAADAASRAKSEFVATISHEIRTPIAAVLGAAELLSQERLGGESAPLVDAIRASCGTLLAVAEDVLDFAAIEAGRIELREESFDLAVLLRDLAAYADVRARGRALTFRLDDHRLGVRRRVGDAGRVRQILVNLLSNALKFTDRGQVVLRAADAGNELIVEVEDTGPGIERSVLQRLFQPFAQADSSTRRRHGGTGLGLVIARRLAERMGGTLEVESEVGRGSTFRFRAPVPSASDENGPQVAAAPGPEGVRILLVEDDEGLASLLAANLRRHGVRVERARNGAEALATARAWPFDAVVMDVHMPELDGFEAAALLRDEHGPGLAIVGLTGAATPEDRQRGLDGGMDAYLFKPVTTAQVVSAIDGAVRTARQRAARQPQARG